MVFSEPQSKEVCIGIPEIYKLLIYQDLITELTFKIFTTISRRYATKKSETVVWNHAKP
jgi:hypothetical protein